ncbi:MAG: agglutinin biogenesis protein MshI [Betaproteobacteria bacterium]
MGWGLKREKTEQGWLSISMRPGALSYVHGRRNGGGKCTILRCGTQALAGEFEGADRVARELGFSRYQCSTLLEQGQYQVLQVEAPNVPQIELRTAIRWRVKDLLDYHVDDATIDVLDVPPDPGGGGRTHYMYAIAAQNALILECIGRFEAAKIPLKVIEVEETAQRNVATLYESGNRGVALLHVGERNGLLTINFRGELYLARRIEIGMKQLLSAQGEARDDLLGRIALEVQRTFDHFDRQFPFVAIEKLLLGPEPAASGLSGHLAQNLGLPVESVKLGEAVGYDAGVSLDAEGEWRMFHLLGASLRLEEKAL